MMEETKQEGAPPLTYVSTQRSTSRKVQYPEVEFDIHEEVKPEEFDKFIKDLESFEREENCMWIRSTLPSATQLV